MTKEFKTISAVSKYFISFGEVMNLVLDSYLVEHDLIFDAELIKDWASQKGYEYMSFISYIRKRGTFTNWGSSNLTQDFEDWKYQKVGMLKVSRTPKHTYIVEYFDNWETN